MASDIPGDQELMAKQRAGEEIEDCPTDLKGPGQANLTRFLLKAGQGDTATIWRQVKSET